MAWDGTERRKNRRFSVKNGVVRYQKGGLFSFFNPPSQKYILLNLSEGGLHFICEEPVSQGQNLTLLLEAPAVTRTVKLKGKVIWVRKSENRDAWRVGVAFTGGADKDKDQLKHLLDASLLETTDISTSLYMKNIKRL